METNETKRFDFYRDLKQVMKSQHRQCKDRLSSSSNYCLECRESSCSNCSIINHQKHPIVYTLPYYLNENNSIIEDHFASLNKIIDEDKGSINVPQLRQYLTQLIQGKVGEIEMTLEKVKEFKLKEVNTLLENSDSAVSSLKYSVKQIKGLISDFIVANNAFIAFSPSIEGMKSEDAKSIQSQYTNNDFGNSSFLMRYDILEASSHCTQEIVQAIEDINASVDKYKDAFVIQAEALNDFLRKMLVPTAESFNYSQMTQNYFAKVEEKLITYNDLISTLKTSVFDSVTQHHSFEDIDKRNILSESKNKQRIDSVLNTENNQQSNFTTINHQTITLTEGINNNKKSMNRTDTNRTHRTYNCKSHRGEKPDSIPEMKLAFTEINLNQESIQKYFTYQMLELLTSMHQMKKTKTKTITEKANMIYEEEVDIAKPLPETNEIQVYDRKTLTTHRRKIHFDKSKHQYTYFLNGSRSILIKDRLYITGGLDKEMKESNMCFVYYIKTNELKPMPEMKNSRAYHSIEFLEYFKSIIVIGGESNSTCELYDMYTSKWKPIPNLNHPRSNSSIYLDRITNTIYSCFGVQGSITKVELYSDTIEKIELKKANNGWSKVDYVNRSEMDFRNSYCRLFPIDHEKLLIYGASGVRELKKQSAIFLLKNHEIIKLDSKTYNEMRLCAKKSEKMNEIISKFI